MTQPEHFLLKRRLQILDDTTRDERRSDAVESDKRAIQSEDTSEDSWVKNFMGRLAGLVRHLDNRK